MQFFSIKRTMVILGAVAALLLGTGIVPSMTGQTATAQAAGLGQYAGGYGWNGGGDGWHGGGHGWQAGFNGQTYQGADGFSNPQWGGGFHRLYPSSYVPYDYDPAGGCGSYYFADGTWCCFTGN
jgi:hypothetical protein